MAIWFPYLDQTALDIDDSVMPRIRKESAKREATKSSLVGNGRRRVFSEAASREGHPDASGNLLFDPHASMLMREHGVSRLPTRDTGFHRWPFHPVVDPSRLDGASRKPEVGRFDPLNF